MKGELDPVVLLPRYTSLLDTETFTTVPLDVEEYGRAAITFWRGPMPSSSGTPTFTAYLEDSHDGTVWSSLNGSGVDPGAGASSVVRVDLNRRWLRAKVVVGGTQAGTGVTCWAVGTLERRVDGEMA